MSTENFVAALYERRSHLPIGSHRQPLQQGASPVAVLYERRSRLPIGSHRQPLQHGASPVAVLYERRSRLPIGGHRPPLQDSSSFAILQIANFARVGPIFRDCGQPGSNRIRSHIIPLLRIGLAAAEQMVKETLLPMRGLASKTAKGFRERVLERFYPVGE